MKLKITILAVAMIAAVGLARGHAWAIGTETAGGGLTGTPHDFTLLNGTATGDNTTNVGQCTFCHTPHGAVSTNLLWNHTLSAQTYQWDVPLTTGGTNYPVFSDKLWNGPTAKCLSCHDGTVAIGSVYWFNGKAQVLNTATTTLAGLTTSATPTTTNAVFSGVHPVAIAYPWANTVSTYNGTKTGSNVMLSDYAGTTAGNVRIYYQGPASSGGATNVVLGYNGASSSATAIAGLTGSAGIECSSCHDPHNKITKDGYFLVGLGTGGGTTYLCNMCHLKYAPGI